MRRLLLILALGLCGCSDGSYTTTGGTTYSTEDALNQFGSSEGYQQGIDPQTYLERLFLDPYDPSLRLYIPKYVYFQGLAYSKARVEVVGQMRLIGGAVAVGDASVRDGGMITTNPDYLKNRFTPSKARYQILEWKEVP